MRLTLPFPPSVNKYYRHINKGQLAGRTLISEEGRAFRSAVDAVVRQARARKALATPWRFASLSTRLTGASAIWTTC